jgi:hypothetical protein
MGHECRAYSREWLNGERDLSPQANARRWGSRLGLDPGHSGPPSPSQLTLVDQERVAVGAYTGFLHARTEAIENLNLLR